MDPAPFRVLYEDNHLLAVSKPAMLPTMGVPAGKPNLLAQAKQYIKQKYRKPGNVYLGIVSRLDAPVTGVVIMARTSKSAARLAEQFRNRQVDKIYWAMIPGEMDPQEDTCVDWIRRDERHRRMLLSRSTHPLAQEARLAYRTIGQVGPQCLLEVSLETGRKHQIRIQLASRGHPVLGDRKYGSQTSFACGIALHSRRLGLIHPVRKTPLELVAPVSDSWAEFGKLD